MEMPRARIWTDDDLRSAVAAARSFREVQRLLGLRPTSTVFIAQHVKRLELSTSHFRQDRVDDAQLREAVRVSTSTTDVLRKLGRRNAGGTHAHFAQRIRELGCDTSHFLLTSTGQPGPTKSASQILIKRPGEDRRVPARQLRSALAAIGRPYVCEGCGTGASWNGKPIVLHVEHRDGDYSNCVSENLAYLCPNCHSQTATYARKKLF